jgi:glyoxylase-like metal-dependent hydrolase (beta-lactamase superfamily II)
MQIHLGYFSIDHSYFIKNAEKNLRTLLASNIYVIKNETTTWILDSGYSDKIKVPYFKAKLKRNFLEILQLFDTEKDLRLILSHAHPDHIGGILENFEYIQKKSIPIFFNTSAFEANFYEEFEEIITFFKEKLAKYNNLIPLKSDSTVDILHVGGHTPEHSVIQFKNSKIVYAGDIIPTHYHFKNTPLGEGNFDEEQFSEIRHNLLKNSKKYTFLLPHSPNEGIF